MKGNKAFAVMGSVAAMALALTACGGGSGSADGGADGKTMRLALNQTETHPSYIALDSFGERLSESTEGRWDIDVYANETLGAQQEAIQLVSDGTVEMAIVSGTQLENLNEDFRVFNLPQVFDDVEHQMKVVGDEEITGELYSSLEDQKITVLGGFTQGTRSVYNTEKPINTPEDLAGMKVRVQESDVHMKMIELMGGSATPMAFGEVYTALQSGVLDGAENNEISYLTQKHNEVAEYFSNTNHLVGLDYLVINTDVLAEMSEEDRAAFDAEWDAAVTEHTELWLSETDAAIKELEAAGTKFNDVDTEAFRTALQPLIDEYVTTDSAKALYQATRAAAE
ncbi:TRAP transporter substrate-binding protein [Arthrobacter crystallopoietes]|uniref:Tripartite ATP-independent transporter solute receptor, DctP family n=1 Tax=Crystallibacter crystallopoietes TaxID=37928 RepID=A0A1H1GA23_9MICC|nr:TRAP transporter substrate-binding protein [Arthrobacter crystallopoietes]AUI52694.1 C4-dicarboxylate ABC transporter [Arthrobacter crystallopoietes]SDR09686.1 tripartite ATP-independent transporter solute receptor, DctP family [Arthrobacter crystallopoietes]